MIANTKKSTVAVVLFICVGLMFGCSEDETATGNMNDSVDLISNASADTSDLLPHQQMAKDLLKELIEIDTTHSTGDVTRAAKAMADRLIAAGFPAQDVKVLAPVAR